MNAVCLPARVITPSTCGAAAWMLAFVLVALAGTSAAIANWSTCGKPCETPSSAVYVQLTPGDNPIRLVALPPTSDDKYSMLFNALTNADPTLAVLFADFIWAGAFAPYLLDLNLALTQDELNVVAPQLLQFTTINGARIADPYYVNAGFLYYRKDLLAKYGFTGPPSTWDELEHQAAVIMANETTTNPNFWGYSWQGSAYEGLTCNALELFASHGAGTIVDADGHVSFNNAAGLKALTRMQRWIGWISSPACAGYIETDSEADFLAGNSVFHRNWPATLGTLQGTPLQHLVGIALLPNDGPGTRSHGTLGGWMVGINKAVAMRGMAVDILLALVSPKTQVANFRNLGRLPTRSDMYFGSGLCQPFNLSHAQICDVTPLPDDYIVNRFSAQTTSNYVKASSFVYKAVNDVLVGRMSPQDALNQAECLMVALLHGRDALPGHCLFEVRVANWATSLVTAITSASIVIVVLCIAAVTAQSAHPVMKAASPSFCVAILTGGAILLSSNYAAAVYPPSWPGSCWVSAWLFAVGFALMMGALIFKHWRVYRIFRSTSSIGGTGFRVVKLTNVMLARYLSIMLAAVAAAMGVWMALQGSTPVSARVFVPSPCAATDQDLRQFSFVCAYNAPGLWLLGVGSLALVATATVLAIRSRHIAMLMYNESAHMAVCTYNIMLVTTLTIPVMALTSGNATTLLVIRAVATVIVVLGSVVSLFAQKFWIIAFYSPEDVDRLAKQRARRDTFNTNMAKVQPLPPL
ncbi:unnamed protein product (mitochondrion) [Plasmodiophora brassicae]|uniref:G-protein coupled receptors family 3 profile domain-containing protein n=1 Tax=Plasmodiophora brassicae TaxID=37360 RepID=A0A3P3YA44_PLABS|nr:unnamed protein product [Plasmodiophora brassicae]